MDGLPITYLFSLETFDSFFCFLKVAMNGVMESLTIGYYLLITEKHSATTQTPLRLMARVVERTNCGGHCHVAVLCV